MGTHVLRARPARVTQGKPAHGPQGLWATGQHQLDDMRGSLSDVPGNWPICVCPVPAYPCVYFSRNGTKIVKPPIRGFDRRGEWHIFSATWPDCRAGEPVLAT